MRLFAACALAWVTGIAVFPIVVALLAKSARVQLAKVVFGAGPTIVARRLGSARVEVRWVPFTSWVRFVGQLSPEREEDPPLRPGRVTWHEATRFGRTLAFVIAPRAVVLAVAAIVLGPARALHAFVHDVPELLMGAFGPFSTARGILDAAASVLAREGMLVVFALALTKWLAFTLVAFFGDIAGTSTTSDEEAVSYGRPRAIMQVMQLMFVAIWLVASIAWALRA